MGSSTTPPAARPAPSSPALRLVAKGVLGVAGFAGFALLGAGGAWLYKHYVVPAPLGTLGTLAEPAPAASSSAVAVPAPAAAPPPETPVAATVVPPPAEAMPEGDPTVEAPTAAGPPVAHRPTTHASTRPARADRAACLDRVNAITVDVSLRHEPPTPEQLAILKRGCK